VRLHVQNCVLALHNRDRGAEQFCRPCAVLFRAIHAIAVAQSHLRQTLLAQLKVHGVDARFANELPDGRHHRRRKFSLLRGYRHVHGDRFGRGALDTLHGQSQ
jgi:hypothetical protein